MSKTYHFLIACGGTGGHLFPGIAVAEQLQQQGHQATLLLSQKKVDQEASAKYSHLTFRSIEAIAKPKTFSLKMLAFLWKFRKTQNHCRAIIQEFRADAVLGMGGFTSLPPILAGKKLGLKTFVHDSNALPGKANRLASRFCNQVFIGMEDARPYFPQHQPLLTGTPVRREIRELPSREIAAKHFGLDPAKPCLIIMGGSQGAKKLNDLIFEASSQFPENLQILHIAGSNDFSRLQEKPLPHPNYKLLGFCSAMAEAYAAADLILTRSGASSLTEIANAKLPSLLVPFPFAADDHQTKNAEQFSRVGAAELLPEASLTASLLAEKINTLFAHPETLRAMSQAAQSLNHPDAAATICDAILKTLSPLS